MINSKDRERIGYFLDKLQPIFWIWLVLVVVLFFSSWREVGFYLLGAYGLLWCVLTALSKPDHCQQGHADIGFYYGRWSCRTCYRLEQQRWGRRARRGFDKK
jgi:hypothetical protein